MEEWREVVGYEGLYQVSNLGKIRSINRLVKHSEGNLRTIFGQTLLTTTCRNGYTRVRLFSNGRSRIKNVHRLVAEAFILNPDNKPQINHKDYDKSNNKVDNLEWNTALENMLHSINTGLRKTYKRAVIQYDLDDIPIREFSSLKEVRENLGIHESSIVNCCKKPGSTSGGFRWKYKE